MSQKDIHHYITHVINVQPSVGSVDRRTHLFRSGEADTEIMVDHRHMILGQQYIKLYKICPLKILQIALCP